jgi:hypothetical protein
MNRPSKERLKQWLASPAPAANLREQIRRSPTAPVLLEAMQRVVPDVTHIAPLTYTLYREFEHTGSRPGYQEPYFLKRAQLSRAVFAFILGDVEMRDVIHDLLWSICEETSWVVPAHEEQGPGHWDLDPPRARTGPLGAHTALTREPDSIDLFAAETGATLAETIHLVGDELAPEVRQRVRQEVACHIFKPYLAYARNHWWFKGALNWNGVCNGSIGLAFLRLERDAETLAEALSLVLEGFEAYIATGFEADGGSIEGVGYWNYGLMYYVIVAELLREITGGALDLLSQPRLRDIAAYPPGMSLVAPDRFVNFGDALERQPIAAGIAGRLAERTGVDRLRALSIPLDEANQPSMYDIAKLAVIFRLAAWWDCTQPIPPLEQRDFFLPECGIVKFTGQTESGAPVILATKAGHTDGHHSHTDIATFIVNVGGESLLPDPGRGLYSKDYFRQRRYENIFNNSYSHNLPRIGGALQSPGPEFGGRRRFYGIIVERGVRSDTKFAVIDYHNAYDVPALTRARRTLELNTSSGVVTLHDDFAFDGDALEVEEAFSTWLPVEVEGSTARIRGEHITLELAVAAPGGVVFSAESLEAACRENAMDNVLTRLSVALPPGVGRFSMTITPVKGQTT